MNIPNALTLFRFLLVGVFPYLYFHQGLAYNKVWAFAVSSLAGATDVLDGFIARRCNLITKWGKLMDPLADKLMMISVLVCLFLDKVIPLWAALIIALKESLMIFGAAFLYRNRRVVVQANFYGKLATFLFYVAITSLIFELPYANYILSIAILSTILALLKYASLNFKREKKDVNNF